MLKSIMRPEFLSKVISTLKRASKKWPMPSVTQISLRGTPYQILISTLLSLRTKDAVTLVQSKRLFARAKTPQEMLKLEEKEIARLIFPVAFYRIKAKRICEISKILLEKYQGRVPSELNELLELKGVGRKTANLVITLAFRKLGICVDTHVHRISNRLGWVKTRAPEQTEFALRKILPTRYWILYNDLLVAFGQVLCRPVSPWCSLCPIEENCPKQGVLNSR
jgi:endonuclease-3